MTKQDDQGGAHKPSQGVPADDVSSQPDTASGGSPESSDDGTTEE